MVTPPRLCASAVHSFFRPCAVALGFLASSTQLADAQVAPNESYRTIKTEHFYVHFTPPLEEAARRAAVYAERAHARLKEHLTPARGKIDLVLADNVDLANGSATPFPSNRIVVFASPPVFQSALRFTDDPLELVLVHELVHIFHLDRSRGMWRLLQTLMGRTPFFFPNIYEPSWLVEGLAVYYESLITGSGRIEGSEHRMIAEAAALAHMFPRIDQLSLARPHFPYGESAYAYGSLFMDHLARVHGDTAMKRFVEAMSAQIIPWLVDLSARRAFGRSFTAEYRRWADSLVRHAPPWSPPMAGWRDLTVDGAFANFPRWLNDSSIVYTGTPGRESYGAYKLTLSPAPDITRPASLGTRLPPSKRERIGRRNTRSPNTVLGDGSLLYSQIEFTSPYHVRSDLYLDRARGGRKRLTHGARLAFPDARADGLIVAVQMVPSGTRLALVSNDGKRITPITSGTLDEHWAEPRWSPDGRHIAASRWRRGGTSEIVVLDTVGRIVQTVVSERALSTTPSWSRDGRFVYFSSDRDGLPDLYRASFARAFPDTLMIPDLQRVSNAQTGLFEAQPSPNDSLLAAVVFKADGYHVGVAPIGETLGNAEPLPSISPRALAPTTKHEARSTKYSPWRTLLPRYYFPYVDRALESGAYRIGAFTSGTDVIGRHSYETDLAIPTDNSGLVGSFYYTYAGFKQPFIELFASQEWENFRRIFDASQGNRPIGILRRRIREGLIAFTVLRPRVRTNSFVSLGAGIEARDYAVDSTPLINRIDSLYRRDFYYPQVNLSAGWSNAQFPPLAISPEDGFSGAMTTRYRWRTGAGATSATVSFVANATAYKSLDLPGFAHHVLALHGAMGVQDNRGTGYFEVGGISSGVFDIFPGYTLGEGRRTFSVRGFPVASLLGIRAVTGSLEYRLPLVLPGRGLGTLPLFFDRTSLTFFGDAGTAWCPGIYVTRPAPATSLCTQADIDNEFAFRSTEVIGSAGGELVATAALFSWDVPIRWRLGFAVPVVGRQFVFGEKPQAYFTVGLPF